ncbi:hypothetical protein ACFQX6_43105 [Streptosporangium lutulentum]
MSQTEPISHGAILLDALLAALTRYVILPSPEAAWAVTLWVAASHGQPAWAHAPRLVIRAPEKRCGKSRLLDVVEATCHNPFITVNSSSAAVYRSITDDPPTMLVDEADTIFGPKADGNEDLRGLLNAATSATGPPSAMTPTPTGWSPSRPSPWPHSPASAPCPTPSKTAPSW